MKTTQFRGIMVGGQYTLVPDSDSGTRPNALRVENAEGIIIIINGGTSPLNVMISSSGNSMKGFLKKMRPDREQLLSKIASGLPGRLNPDAENILHDKWMEDAGGGNWWMEEIEEALKELFQGVENTLMWEKILGGIPFAGKLLSKWLII